MERWYLVCHKPGRDNFFRAQMSTQRKHLNCFSPQVRVSRPRSDRDGQRNVIEPLFDGYLFIELDPENIHPMKIEEECAGISHFVRQGMNILPIPDFIIHEIMALPLCSEAVLLNKSRRERARERKLQKQATERACKGYALTTRSIQQILTNPDPDSRTAMFLALTGELSRKMATSTAA